MEAIRHILMVNRLTQDSYELLRHGVDLAKLFGAELSIIHVVSNPVDMEAVNAPGLFIKGEEYKNYMSVRQQYKEELDKAILKVTRGGFPIRELLTTTREPVAEIIHAVKTERVDLIVTLAHEEGRLEYLLFGGENADLIRQLPCSVLLIKHEPQPVRWETASA